MNHFSYLNCSKTFKDEIRIYNLMGFRCLCVSGIVKWILKLIENNLQRNTNEPCFENYKEGIVMDSVVIKKQKELVE